MGTPHHATRGCGRGVTAQVLAMVGERREVKALFDELLGPDGMEVRGKFVVAVRRVGVGARTWRRRVSKDLCVPAVTTGLWRCDPCTRAG